MLVSHPYAFYVAAVLAANVAGILFGYSLSKARIKWLKERLYFARMGM